MGRMLGVPTQGESDLGRIYDIKLPTIDEPEIISNEAVREPVRTIDRQAAEERNREIELLRQRQIEEARRAANERAQREAAELKARLEAQRKAKEEAARKAAADRKAREEAARKAEDEAEYKPTATEPEPQPQMPTITQAGFGGDLIAKLKDVPPMYYYVGGGVLTGLIIIAIIK